MSKNVMRWSPDGEPQVFANEADVPEGWTDKHPHHYGVPQVRESTPAPEPAPPPDAPARKPITLRRRAAE
jgi:hypothetical protein